MTHEVGGISVANPSLLSVICKKIKKPIAMHLAFLHLMEGYCLN
jgi:hypothetical protein